jgi:hypothetical protein
VFGEVPRPAVILEEVVAGPVGGRRRLPSVGLPRQKGETVHGRRLGPSRGQHARGTLGGARGGHTSGLRWRHDDVRGRGDRWRYMPKRGSAGWGNFPSVMACEEDSGDVHGVLAFKADWTGRLPARKCGGAVAARRRHGWASGPCAVGSWAGVHVVGTRLGARGIAASGSCGQNSTGVVRWHGSVARGRS